MRASGSRFLPCRPPSRLPGNRHSRRPALRREPSQEARIPEVAPLGKRPRGAAGFVQKRCPRKHVEKCVCFPEPRAKLLAHAAPRTRAGTHQWNAATSGGLALCPGMLPGFPATGTLGRGISAAEHSGGRPEITHQGLLPLRPSRRAQRVEGRAPGPAWRLGPLLRRWLGAAP